MALDFPSSPANGDTYGEYTYNSSLGVWRATPVLPGGLPAGTIMAWGGANAPSNWLICDGTAVSRSTYASLWNVLSGGTGSSPYGNGDGSTTFNLPDLRGRVPVGKNTATSLGTATMTIAAPGVVTLNAHGLGVNQRVYFTTTGALPTGLTANTVYYVKNVALNTFQVAATLGGTSITTSGTQSGTHTLYRADFADLGGAGGNETNTLAAENLPPHRHQFGSDDQVATQGGYTTISTFAYDATSTNTGNGVHMYTQNLYSGSGTSNITGAGANSVIQPFQVVNYIIKYSGANTPGDSALALRVGAEETLNAGANKSGLVPVVPTSAGVNAGSASVNAVGVVSFSGNPTTITVNGVFSAAYTRYLIQFYTDGVSPADTGVLFNFTVAGIAQTQSAYNFTIHEYTTSGVHQMASGTSQAYANTLRAGTSYGCNGEIQVFNPYNTIANLGKKLLTRSMDNAYVRESGCVYTTANIVADGFRLNTGGATTFGPGSIRVYGFRD